MLKDYFFSHQDWRKDQPAKQITLEEARKLKQAGTHFFVNHGQAIAEIPQAVPEVPEALQKSKWVSRPSGCQVLGIAPVNVLQLI